VAARRGVGRAARRAGIVRRAAGSKTTSRTSPPGFSRLAFAVAAASPSDVAVGLGRVPAGASGRIRLQSLLRALPTLAQEAGCSSSPGTPAWREGFRGLGQIGR